MKLLLRTRYQSWISFLLALCLAVGAFFGVAASASTTATASSSPLAGSTPTFTLPQAGIQPPTEEGIAIAQVAVVRIVAHYTVTYKEGILPDKETDAYCTGLGVLVQSPGVTGTTGSAYLLTASTVLAQTVPCTEVVKQVLPPQGATVKGSSFAGASVYLSSAYTETPQAVEPFQVASADVASLPATSTPATQALIPLRPSKGTAPHDYPTVQVSAAGAPGSGYLLDLLDQSQKQGVTSSQINRQFTNPTQAPATPTAYLTPKSVQLNAGAEPTTTSPGAPVIDGQTGAVIGIVAAQGAAPTQIDAQFAAQLATLPNASASCPQVSNQCFTQRWKQAMDGYYSQDPAKQASAQKLLSDLSTTYPDFQGVANFQTTASRRSDTPPPPAAETGLLGQLDTPSKIALIVLFILLILVFIMAIMIYVRRVRRNAQKRAAPAGSFHTRKSGQLGTGYAGPPDASQTAPYIAATPQGMPVQRTIVCPRCGTQNNAGSSNCAHCGAELPQGVGGISGINRGGLGRSTSGGGQRLNLPGNQPMEPATDIAEMPTITYQQMGQPMQAGNEALEMTLPTMPAAAARQGEATVVMRGRKRPALGVKVSTKSDLGERWRKRGGKENEDNFLAVTGTWMHNGQLQPFGLFVVADGMGGHANGQDASRMAVETIYHHLAEQLPRMQDVPDDQLTTLLQQAVQQANQMIYHQNQRDHADMGCTMTAALVTGNEAYICNVGDSRTYILTPESHLQRITTDHSIVESLVAAGVIQRDDVYTHPKRNQIYRSLGEHEAAEIDTFRQPLASGDKLLLCCDGLWEMVRDPDIEQVMRLDDLPQITSKLIDMANEAGGADNITAIVVKVTDQVKPAKAPMIESVACGPANIPQPRR